MAKYKIYMVKLGPVQVGNEAETGTALKGFVDRVIASHPPLQRSYDEGAEVTWMTSCPAAEPHELIVYVVQDASDSIVVSLPGLSGNPSRSDAAGLTVWAGQLTASEIYTNQFGNNSDMLSKVAFHEIMHNKTHRGSNLHSGGGLAASPLSPQSNLTTANIRLMRGVLGSARPQWTGGCTAYNDPIRGMGL